MSKKNRLINRELRKFKWTAGNCSPSQPTSSLIRVTYTASGRRRPLGFRHPDGTPHLFALPHADGFTFLDSSTAAETLIPMKEAAKLAAVYATFVGVQLPVAPLRHALASLRVGDATRVRLYDAEGRVTFDIREGSIDSSDAVNAMAASMFFRCFHATSDAPVVANRIANAESVLRLAA